MFIVLYVTTKKAIVKGSFLTRWDAKKYWVDYLENKFKNTRLNGDPTDKAKYMNICFEEKYFHAEFDDYYTWIEI